MKVNVSVPELMLIAATRGALGIGLGLLLAPRLGAGSRKAVGLTLLSVGVLSTIPIAMHVFGKKAETQPESSRPEYPMPTTAPVL